MPAKSVDQHRPLSDQEVAGLVQHQHGLLLDRLHRNEAHRRPGHRLGNRLGVRGIGLPALDVGFDIGGRHQPHLMPKGRDLPGPVMGRRARLHPDQARRQPLEEPRDLATTQPSAGSYLAIRTNRVNLKYALRDVDTHNRDRLHVRLLSCGVPKRKYLTRRSRARPQHHSTSRDTARSLRPPGGASLQGQSRQGRRRSPFKTTGTTPATTATGPVADTRYDRSS